MKKSVIQFSADISVEEVSEYKIERHLESAETKIAFIANVLNWVMGLFYREEEFNIIVNIEE